MQKCKPKRQVAQKVQHVYWMLVKHSCLSSIANIVLCVQEKVNFYGFVKSTDMHKRKAFFTVIKWTVQTT